MKQRCHPLGIDLRFVEVIRISKKTVTTSLNISHDLIFNGDAICCLCGESRLLWYCLNNFNPIKMHITHSYEWKTDYKVSHSS